jgi:hypothetical protein
MDDSLLAELSTKQQLTAASSWLQLGVRFMMNILIPFAQPMLMPGAMTGRHGDFTLGKRIES